jgi:hypothetical protein
MREEFHRPKPEVESDLHACRVASQVKSTLSRALLALLGRQGRLECSRGISFGLENILHN